MDAYLSMRGSSTELAPSVIGYYDRLSTGIEQIISLPINDSKLIEQPEPTIIKPSYTSPVSAKVHLSTSQNSAAQLKHKSFRVLSQKVQRIISHSSSDGDILDTHKKIDNETSPHIINTTKYFKRVGSLKNKHSNLPLSKNTCKLTQAGNELVDTLDSKIFNSNESLDGQVESKRLSKTIVTNHEPIAPPRIAKSRNIQKIIERLQSVNNTESDDEIDKSANMSTNETKANEGHRPVGTITEAINYFVTIPTDLHEVEVLKNLQIDDVSNEQIQTEETAPIQPTIESILDDGSVDNQDEHKDLPSQRISLPKDVTESPFNNKTSLTIPDIARLKHRPLSASSICSTSSSSSTGSENSTGKIAVSYLASVESLADHSESELLNSNMTLCERACREIIDSEKTYVDDLGQVIKGYLQDWKERACLRYDELKTLFSNIEDVYEFNSIFLKQLLNSGTDPVNIAKCFINMKDRFDAYTVYCTRYPEAISLLTSLLQASHTNALLTSTQKMLQHTLPLGSYLLKPVQRILRYHLLLDNLRKHCDVSEVTEAHLLMKDVAKNIDQVKKNLEQQSRVKELSGILDGWLGPELTVLGDLKLEGPLMENNKPRIVLLFQTMLIITKKKEDNRLQYKNFIHCKHLMLIEHLRGEPCSFNVIPYPHPSQIKLTAKNREVKRQWAHHIKQVMLAHFDIPSRAVELVFKLGDDEEGSTSDKNTWKWGTNSSSATPEYLERRNQYRRSEMRYRSSKKQRKTMAASISMEGFDSKTQEKYFNRSMDDSILSAPKSNLKTKINCNHRDDNCNCSLVKSELNSTLSRKNGMKDKDGRGRSKSEPRISDIFINKHNTFPEQSPAKLSTESLFPKAATINMSKARQTDAVKRYTTKTLPKRIANLKKQRARSMKETSKFYMELPIEDTVLRITESTENLSKVDGSEEKPDDTKTALEIDDSTQKTDERLGTKKDVEIICDLLKEKQKEFDRILNKPPKKKSFDNGKFGGCPEVPVPPHDADESTEKVPQAPERIYRANSSSEFNANEPIYESLLRNVHVPYKYSPVLSRSISQPQQKTCRVAKRERPESDYVTLVYSGMGQLQSVDGHVMVASFKVDPLTMRNSDSNINYNKVNASLGQDDEGISSSSSGNLDSQNSLNNESIHVEVNDENSIKDSCSTISNKSIDNISTKTTRSERRTSDASTDLCHQHIFHKQGSESLGSRIAHLDYADPKTLFASHSNNNILINKHFLKTQRDSAFSLTSSNDSVNDTKQNLLEVLCNDSYYEKSVEDSLEQEDVFRDSAIYSDDCNERKTENLYEVPNYSPPPLPRKSPPRIPKKPLRSPPPLPPKPMLNMQKVDGVEMKNDQVNEQQLTADSSLLSPTDSNCSSSSWVLTQIKNFEK
ncbi:Pleckstrin likey domain-containing family G member 1 [Pseudolycoriella hygida]|uniref:Pleckstrin likey domain-containing family G member 1 n=1 Tax=Pseudolycoriella hygida TaxID=35572 RepID=A0A9Q0N007_9DIPT|nr:Pleckstrin likey domain-containing family G member 1 [Pseudolycoriella hygida]